MEGLKEKKKEVLDLEKVYAKLESARTKILKTTGYSEEVALIQFLQEIVKEQEQNENFGTPTC